MPIPVGQYEALAGQMLSVYDQAELIMIRRVAKRLSRGVTSPGWTERKLLEAGAVRRQLQSTLSGLRRNRIAQVDRSIATAYSGGQRWFFADATEYALAVGTQHIAPSTARVAAILSDLNERMDAADRMILRRANDAYADVIAQAASLEATGTITTREAVSMAVMDFADRGISSFVDKAGRRWEMGTYAEMATLTALSRASVSGYTDTMGKYGYDLAIISSHADACPICAAWQGVIVSVSGRDRRYPSLDDAYAAGVFHPRCIHHLSIWHEGITHGAARRRPGRVDPPSPGYTARSRQRQCERMVRRYKRRQAAATTPLEERQARAMVSKWQGEVRRTIAEAPNILTRHYEREGGRVNLSEAARKIRPPTARGQPSRVPAVLKNALGHDIIRAKGKPAKRGEANSIVQMENKRGGIDRNYYDSRGVWFKQITNHNHGNPKMHTFGAHGEHAHDFEWEGERQVSRTTRELSESERKENADIL